MPREKSGKLVEVMGRESKSEIEIERKWSIVRKKIPNLSGLDKIEIDQGYFEDEGGRTHRLRKYVDKFGSVHYQMQTKTKLGTKRSQGSMEETRELNKD